MKLIKFPKLHGWIVFLVFFLLNGCSLFAPEVELQKVTIDVESMANDDTPIRVDFVAASDLPTLERIRGLTAQQWNDQQDQLQRDFPKGLRTWRVEVVPGQSQTWPNNVLHGQKAQGLVVFADYSAPGAHRLLLDGQHSIWLKMGAREMRLLDAQGQ